MAAAAGTRLLPRRARHRLNKSSWMNIIRLRTCCPSNMCYC
jgi:hypothetical protein